MQTLTLQVDFAELQSQILTKSNLRESNSGKIKSKIYRGSFEPPCRLALRVRCQFHLLFSSSAMASPNAPEHGMVDASALTGAFDGRRKGASRWCSGGRERIGGRKIYWWVHGAWRSALTGARALVIVRALVGENALADANPLAGHAKFKRTRF